MTSGGGVLTMAEDITFAMYRWSRSLGIFNLAFEKN